jgi:hypothetical protein
MASELELPLYNSTSMRSIGRRTWAGPVWHHGSHYWTAIEVTIECRLRIGLAVFHLWIGDWVLWRRGRIVIVRKAQWGIEYREYA